MPTVTIISPTEVSPEVVQLRRDDQTILWMLGPGLKWGCIDPIQYMRGGGSSPADLPYKDWPRPASHPQPVDPENRETGMYWASANDPLPGDQPQWYRYQIYVKKADEVGAGEEDLAVPRIYKVQIKRKDKDGWYDPDVLNDPQP